MDLLSRQDKDSFAVALVPDREYIVIRQDQEVQACFRRVLNGLTFAAPSNKQVAIVEYTFVLKSEDPS